MAFVREHPFILSAAQDGAHLDPAFLARWRKEFRARLGPDDLAVLVLFDSELLRGAAELSARIAGAPTLEARRGLGPAAEAWFRSAAVPRLRARGSGFAYGHAACPPTGSPAAWEGFLVACLRALAAGCAQELGGTFAVRSPAQLLLPRGELRWRSPAPSRGAPGTVARRDGSLVVVSGHVLAHAYDADGPRPAGPAHTSTLLPGDDGLVLALAAASASRFVPCPEDGMAIPFRAGLPPGLEIERWRLADPPPRRNRS